MTWNELTVKQYQEVIKAVDSDSTDITKAIEILAAVSDKTPNYYRNLLLSETMGEYRKVMDGLGEMPSGKVQPEWKHSGRLFSCQTSLDKFTAGQLIDFSELAKKSPTNEDRIQSYHLFLAIFFHEKGKGYAPESFKERSEFIKNNMPMSVAYPVAQYFFDLWIALLPTIQTYLKEEVAGQTGLPTGGTGTRRSTGWLTSALRLLTRSLSWAR